MVLSLPRFLFAAVAVLASAGASAAELSPWSEWFVLRENILARVRMEAHDRGYIGSRWEFRVDPERLKQVPDLAGMNIYLTFHQTFDPKGIDSHGTLSSGREARRVVFPAGEHPYSIHWEPELLWFPQDHENRHETITWRYGDLLPIVETPANGRKGPGYSPILDGIEVNSERMLRFSVERTERDKYIPPNPPPARP